MVVLLVAGCSPAGVLNAFAEAEASRLITGIAYGSDPRQQLDIYVPTKGRDPYPVVLFFYGGSWNSGTRSDYRFVGLYAGPGSPRSFLAAPQSDQIVDPERNTHQLANKLDANGVAVTYKSYPRVSHVTLIGAMGRPLRWLAPVLDDISEFIRSDGKG